MSTVLKKRFYKVVAANTTETSVVEIPANADVFIGTVGGNACYSNSVKVQLVFGNDVVFVTHGDNEQIVNEHYSSESQQNLTIELCNDSDAAETIGLYYDGDYV